MIVLLLLASMLSAAPDITIDSDTIALGALIPFSSSDARAAISLGYAPNPGLARRVARTEIFNKITAAGMSTDDLQLPESILVHRRAVGLDRDQVTRAILNAFMKQFPNANIEITNVEIPAIQIGTGSLDITATLPARFDPAVAVFVRMDFRGASFVKTAFVRTNVRIEADQPVIRNKIAAHSEIQPRDIEWKMAPVRTDTPPEQLEGMLAKRDLEPGQVVTQDVLYMPLYVHKGESVTVKATAGAVTVSAIMRAKASGKLGETIQVEHLTGEGTTSARIIGPRTLETISVK